MSMGIRSQAMKIEGSETISQESRAKVGPKRQTPLWGEDIVRSSSKGEAVRKVLSGGIKESENGCWEWTGGKSHGYGQVRIREVWGNRPVYAHRASFVVYHLQPIPKGLVICHTCDNPCCINPGHLFLGTQDENLKDMANKGRSCLGAKNGMTKFTEEDVLNIKAEVNAGVKQYVVSEKYGISQAQVSRIMRGSRRWTTPGKSRAQHGNFKHGRYATNNDEQQ